MSFDEIVKKIINSELSEEDFPKVVESLSEEELEDLYIVVRELIIQSIFGEEDN